MLQYYGMLGMPHSWAVVAQFLLVELQKLGVNLKCISTNPLKGIHTDLIPTIITNAQQKASLKTNVSLSYTIPPNLSKIQARHKIIIFNYEFDILPKSFVDILNSEADLILPSSVFTHTLFANSGVAKEKMEILPHGYDPRMFHPDFPPLKVKNIAPDKFKFLIVASPHWRKGHDILLTAYLEEFKHDEDVVLLIKTAMLSNEKISHQHVNFNALFNELKPRHANPWPDIKMIGHKMDYLAPLYTLADALVLPSRGEGFSLTPLEAVACKLPVITTRFGGQMDYLTNQNSYLIDYQMKKAPKEMQYFTFNPNARMAEPDVNHLRKLMRQVKNDHDTAKQKAELAYKQCAESLTWPRVAETLLSMIQKRGWKI
jgi:glycosyltransferase involved in cell wall biosynthesis